MSFRFAYPFGIVVSIAKDRVIIGMNGGEYNVRGYIFAYDAVLANAGAAAQRNP